MLNLIDVRMMIDPAIVFTDLLKEDNYDIHRGKIGIAKKGKVKVNLTYIETREPEFKKPGGDFDVETILSQFQFAAAAVESWCKAKYKMVADPMKAAMCVTALGFCKARMADFIEIAN